VEIDDIPDWQREALVRALQHVSMLCDLRLTAEDAAECEATHVLLVPALRQAWHVFMRIKPSAKPLRLAFFGGDDPRYLAGKVRDALNELLDNHAVVLREGPPDAVV
jgi:hypothetical protein